MCFIMCYMKSVYFYSKISSPCAVLLHYFCLTLYCLCSFYESNTVLLLICCVKHDTSIIYLHEISIFLQQNLLALRSPISLILPHPVLSGRIRIGQARAKAVTVNTPHFVHEFVINPRGKQSITDRKTWHYG